MTQHVVKTFVSRVGAVAIVLALAGCGVSVGGVDVRIGSPATAVPCAEQARQYTALIQPLAAEWDDANKLANSTARMTLAPEIAHLQEIRRKADALTVPACAQSAQTALLTSMNQRIDGYISFLGKASDDVVTTQMQHATNNMQIFQTELYTIVNGTPTPAPTPTMGPHDLGGPVLLPVGDGAP